MPHDGPDRFAWERRLRDDPDVTGLRLAVLLTLATYHDRRRARTRVSVDTLTAATGSHESRVRQALRWAREHGYLEQTIRGHGSRTGRATASEYALTTPPQLPAPQAPLIERSLPVPHAPVINGQPPVPSSSTSGASGTTLQSLPTEETSSSEAQPDDDDLNAVTQTMTRRRALLRSAGTADELWTDRHQQRARDRIWDRLGATTDYNTTLDALVTLRVRDPLAYLASLSDDDLADLSHRPEPNGNGSTAATLDRPAIDNCPHCDHLGFTELDDGRLRRCTHTKAPA